jgi:hypothetical protein
MRKPSSYSSHTLDLADLSICSELLTSVEWRIRLIDIFTNKYKLSYINTVTVTVTADIGGEQGVQVSRGHRCIDTDNFNSLSLLFNITLDACDSENDYPSAHSLVHVASAIYHEVHKVADTDSAADNSSDTVDGSQPAAREYMLYALKRQQMWHTIEFWTYCFSTDLAIRCTTSNASVSTSGSTATAHADDHDSTNGSQASSGSGRELLFDVMANVLHNAISLGTTVDLCRELCVAVDQQHGLSTEKQDSMLQLLHNLTKD